MTLTLLAVTVLVAQTPAKVDASTQLAKMSMLTDGKGHSIAFVKGESSIPEALFWSVDGTTFYRLDRTGGGASGTETWSAVFEDPRSPITRPSVSMRDSGKVFEVECENVKRSYQLVPPEKVESIAKAATFYEPRWQRSQVALLRDEAGVYYFVDQQRSKSRERRDVRVFLGQRGKMIAQPLRDAADDSAGLVLRTKNGDLTLVVNTPSQDEAAAAKLAPSKWVKGAKTTPLVRLRLDDPRNNALVMNDLGVYDGVVFGTPCDAMDFELKKP